MLRKQLVIGIPSPQSRKENETRQHAAPRWLVATLVAGMLVLVGASAIAGAAPTSDQAVSPQLVWNATEGRLIAMAAPEVRAWLRGEIDDVEGLYASWYDRFDRQSREPAFGAALTELQRLVVTQATEERLTKFQVEHELIPTLLRERADLARGLAGKTPVVPFANPQCYRIETGTDYCSHSGMTCCFGDWLCCCEWSCNLRTAGGCSVTEEIPCPGVPAGPSGTMEFQRR